MGIIIKVKEGKNDSTGCMQIKTKTRKSAFNAVSGL
jgi:hypothetical protein